MGEINWVAFGGVLVDLVIISMLISYIYWGYRRGLTAVLFKLLSLIISLLIMFLLYKPVSATIINKTSIDERLAEGIAKNLNGTMYSAESGFDIDTSNQAFSSGVVDLIKSFTEEALELNVDPLAYVSEQLACFMIRVATMLILLMLSKTLLLVLRFATEIIASLPFIRLINHGGGLVYGLIKAFLVIYVILGVISIASPLISSWGIVSAIEDSAIGSKMYNNNLLLNIVLKDKDNQIAIDFEDAGITPIENPLANIVN